MKLLKDKHIWILLLSISIIVGFTFTDFIFGKKVFFYYDDSADSYRVYFPQIYHFITQVLKGKVLFWDHYLGPGQSVFTLILTDPFIYFLSLFHESFYLYFFTIQLIIKFFLSGLLFYWYLRKIKVSSYISVVASLIYAFNGYILIWAPHYHIHTLFIYVPLVLIALEEWLFSGKAIWLIISLTLFWLYSFYFMYPFIIYLVIYICLRIKDGRIKKIGWFIVYLTISFGLAAFFLLPQLNVYLSNPRAHFKLSFLPKLYLPMTHYIVTFFRAISSALLFGDSYCEYYLNFGEDATLGTSILVWVILSQFLFRKNILKNMVFFSVIFLSLPGLAIVMHGFNYLSYRWTFVLMVMFLTFIFIFFDKKLQQKEDFNLKDALKLFIYMSLLWLAFSFYGKMKLEWGIQLKKLTYGYIIFSLYYFVYSFLLFSWQNRKIFSPLGAKTFILVVLISELALNSYQTMVKRQIFTPEKLHSLYFNKDKTKLVNKIKKEKGFFRIRDFSSMPYEDVKLGKKVNLYTYLPNAPLVGGYKGVDIYNSLINKNYLLFQKKFHVFYSPKVAHIENVSLLSLLSVKYFIFSCYDKRFQELKEEKAINVKEREGDFVLVENNFFLPFIRFYKDPKTFWETDFGREKKISSLFSYQKRITEQRDFFVGNISKLKIGKDQIEFWVDLPHKGFLVIPIFYEKGWQLRVDGKEEKIRLVNGMMGINPGKGKHSIVLTYSRPYLLLGIVVSVFTLLLVFSL